MSTPEEATIINADRQRQAALMQERLEGIGVSVAIAHFTGDSSYPEEYTLTYGVLRATGPTMDLAVFDFVEKFLLSNTFKAYQSMEAALQMLVGNILSMKTDLLYIKACVEPESESRK